MSSELKNLSFSVLETPNYEEDEDFGKGFGRSNLYSFYKTYPNIFQSVIGQSFDLLSWTHCSILIGVFDQDQKELFLLSHPEKQDEDEEDE